MSSDDKFYLVIYKKNDLYITEGCELCRGKNLDDTIKSYEQFNAIVMKPDVIELSRHVVLMKPDINGYTNLFYFDQIAEAMDTLEVQPSFIECIEPNCIFNMNEMETRFVIYAPDEKIKQFMNNN